MPSNRIVTLCSKALRSSLLAVLLKPSLIMRARSSRVMWLLVCFAICFECHGLREFVNQSESPPCLPPVYRQTGQAGLLPQLLLTLRPVAVFRNQYPLHLTQPKFHNTLEFIPIKLQIPTNPSESGIAV